MSRRRFPLTLALSPKGERGLAALAGVVLFMLALALSPAHAQDPVSGALATLAAATVQAQHRQAAQAATRQASSAQATATAQAYQAEASATAQAQAVRATDQAIQATGQAMEMTRQALQVEATRAAGAAQVQATAQAQAARATETAYQQEQAEHARQERVAHYAEIFLYAALGLGFAVALLLAWRAYQAMGAVEQAKLPGSPNLPESSELSGRSIVVEGEYSSANPRGLDITVISDPGAVERFEQFVLENGV
ncbi:MAG: hypothetical protein JW850_15615 [Thermoflexales bacterium]|nr:hypothetical protein [Thermoflexales bacterium]